MGAMASQPFWAAPAGVVLGDVGSSSAGLSAGEAGARLKRVGPNEPAPPRRFGALRELGAFVLNPLVLILLVASAVSAAFGQVVSSAIIACMVLLSIVLNFSQSYQSQLAAQRLRDRVGQRATVLRDGRAQEIPAREVVPGDVVRLSAGDLVPGDGRLLSSRDLFLNEAALTGESLPREKHADAAVIPGASVEEAATAVLQGTSVVSGLGEAVVVRTGARTEFGQVAARLAGRAPETEFERGTRRFGILILQVVLVLVFFVIRTAGRPWESRPGAGLACGVCACAATGAIIPFTPLAPWLGFTPLPPLFFAILVLMVATYLGLVEVVKRWFYRRYPAGG